MLIPLGPNHGFSEKYNLNFELLSDLDRSVTKAYNLLFEDWVVFENYTCSNRGVVIIDAEGKIQYRWVAEPNPGVEPNYDEIKRVFKNTLKQESGKSNILLAFHFFFLIFSFKNARIVIDDKIIPPPTRELLLINSPKNKYARIGLAIGSIAAYKDASTAETNLIA